MYRYVLRESLLLHVCDTFTVDLQPEQIFIPNLNGIYRSLPDQIRLNFAMLFKYFSKSDFIPRLFRLNCPESDRACSVFVCGVGQIWVVVRIGYRIANTVSCSCFVWRLIFEKSNLLSKWIYSNFALHKVKFCTNISQWLTFRRVNFLPHFFYGPVGWFCCVVLWHSN